MRVYGTNLPREIHRLRKGLGERNYTALLYKEFYIDNE
ncbi:hypothetical protein SAMN05216230_102434 [Pseudomonas soli]|uniref:Uncharacterized protein n=1 Tax=Pseudomonas soli TaxID=1306993 RepID=A0A1H9F494_9PSED|nr:hypothetical protein SAMN05216230_102434 [Pseudomonas soli]